MIRNRLPRATRTGQANRALTAGDAGCFTFPPHPGNLSLAASDSLIAGYSLTEPGEEWEEILSDFRVLGGVADNIRLDRGRFGRGLFAIDPARPFRLHVPKTLMFGAEDIGFAGDHIGIRDSAGVPKPERKFFERYANALSWGGGSRQELAVTVAAFDALPTEIRTLLAADFGMGAWLDGEAAARIQTQFLHSRVFAVGGRDVLVPMLELANHDCRGFEWTMRDGVEIAGRADGEILVSYGLHDPFSMFHRFAIASREPVAFSLPMKVQIGAIPLIIGRSFEVDRHGDIMLPQLADSAEGITVSFVTLGHANFPKLPRGMFRALTKPLGVRDADEEFDGILHANWTKLLQLLAALESHDGKFVVSLRTMVQYQLEAMSACVGAREI